MQEGLETLLQRAPYDLSRDLKAPIVTGLLTELTRRHAERCRPYGNMLQHLGFDPELPVSLDELPFVPAQLFKRLDLKSVDDSEVHRIMSSSGTSGEPSRIFLDAPTAAMQTKVLSRIVADFLGKARLPMLVIDAPSTVRNRAQINARAAGITGFSLLGRKPTFALKDDLSVDSEAVADFLGKNGDQDFFIFGFTSLVYEALISNGAEFDGRLANGILIHGGGWKKLIEKAVDNAVFKHRLHEKTGLRRIHNYYGLVEQTGSIFMECEAGHMHCSNFSDVLVRDGGFNLLPEGERGMLQLFSVLPGSYPGHVLLTEDEGVVLGEDDCSCGRMGKYFKVFGRIPKAEIRGCSDAHKAAGQPS